MTLKTACAIGILAGLTITAATAWKPKPKPIKVNQINNAWNHPYAFPVQNKPDDLPTIEVDGQSYRISPHASPIPCWFVGGKMISINGTVSDINQ